MMSPKPSLPIRTSTTFVEIAPDGEIQHARLRLWRDGTATDLREAPLRASLPLWPLKKRYNACGRDDGRGVVPDIEAPPDEATSQPPTLIHLVEQLVEVPCQRWVDLCHWFPSLRSVALVVPSHDVMDGFYRGSSCAQEAKLQPP